MAASKTNSADGASHVERLNRDVDEIMAALERGDPSHDRAAAELMRRWEQKGWHLEPSARPGEPPRAIKDGKSSPRFIYGDSVLYA